MAGSRIWLPAVVGLLLAGGVAQLRALLAEPSATAAFVTLLGPADVEAGERFAVFAGAETAAAARVFVRLCVDGAGCVFERVEPFPAGVTFKWIASATLEPGRYRLEAFLQVPTPLGYRSVDRLESEVVAH